MNYYFEEEDIHLLLDALNRYSWGTRHQKRLKERLEDYAKSRQHDTSETSREAA